ncbi:hypothetical protein ACVXHA_12190 [Escherichia coli]
MSLLGRDEFADGASYLQGKKVVIVGCGAQGLNQGLNVRDSGLDISYALRKKRLPRARPGVKRPKTVLKLELTKN